MGSLFNAGGKRFYSLEHKVTSKYHRAGECQQIIVDQIELGRSSTCQVRFDENFRTVSRRHAAIVREGDGWKLVQLSQTNSTYLNGHRVEREWYLQNGDEIQLSTNGPKLGFIAEAGAKGLVKSIGLTARLNLFRKQALRPYKQALTALSCIFVLAILAGGGAFWKIRQDHEREAKRTLAAFEQAKQERDSLLRANEALTQNVQNMHKRMQEMAGRVDSIRRSVETSVGAGEVSNEAIKKCLEHIFYIQVVGFELTLPDGRRARISCEQTPNAPSWSGTGFLLNDGRFVTARHVSEAWYFWADGSGTNQKLAELNLLANNGGKVVAHFVAVSSSGKQLTFTSDQFTCDRSQDRSGTNEQGGRMTLGQLGPTDYAYMKTNLREGLKFDARKSNNLEMRTKLTVLGFPLGLGARGERRVQPIYGDCIVARAGLNQGIILTTNTNYEQGNSGGPVFYKDAKGELSVVGIVSAGAGRVTGFVVPISVIR